MFSLQDTADVRQAYNAGCGPCGTATRALQADTDCTDALSNGDRDQICSGTCNTLLSNFVSSCRNQEVIMIICEKVWLSFNLHL